MPFFSKDWRSPGEEWVKTDEGWEKKKVLECFSKPFASPGELSNHEKKVPPYCHIILRSTKEIAGFNGLSEVVKRLDFFNAVHDQRRFNYICALLHLLVNEQLTTMSGAAQKALLTMVEQVADKINESQQNVQVLRQLAASLREVENCPRNVCWGGSVGSQRLWKRNNKSIQRIIDMANHIRIQGPDPELTPQFMDLPEECIGEILLRIGDAKDVEACICVGPPMETPASDQRTWKQLTKAHYTQNEINCVDMQPHWKDTYTKLRRTFGAKKIEDYAETLTLCRRCGCLFWNSLGHPCVDGSEMVLYHPVQPQEFLKLFSL